MRLTGTHWWHYQFTNSNFSSCNPYSTSLHISSHNQSSLTTFPASISQNQPTNTNLIATGKVAHHTLAVGVKCIVSVVILIALMVILVTLFGHCKEEIMFYHSWWNSIKAHLVWRKQCLRYLLCTCTLNMTPSLKLYFKGRHSETLIMTLHALHGEILLHVHQQQDMELTKPIHPHSHYPAVCCAVEKAVHNV